ncbi:MAG: HAMP domain-containing sensor histidine kinase [Planctomycetaceae bacterium]
MLLLKSIRRRLVTGFTVALVFMLMMTAAAIWGLVRHQTALSELDHLVHHSPDKAQLLERVNLILYPLTEPIDLSRDGAITTLQNRFRENVRLAQAEADEFWRRSQQAAEDPRKRALGFSGRHRVLHVNMTAVKEQLNYLEELSIKIAFFESTSREQRIHHLNTVSMQAHLGIVRIANNLQRLPAYDKELHVVAPLQAEAQQSARLLRRVLILGVVALISYAITIYCGLQWISNPLRTIAKGASRIANGDTDYRLGQVTPWKDEFFDLTENFNRMADRFQESEDDLHAKVQERSRQLVRSERLAGVGFLAAGLAHEINNPLQSITMAAESLQMRLYDHLDPEHADTVEAMERLAMIQRESKRCGGITRKLLDFSRNDTADVRQDGQPEKSLDDLTRVIGEVIDMILPMNQYKDRRIVFTHTAPLLIEINSAQIKQVILNLIANGLQATESGGTVEVRLKDQTDWVVIDICDDGQGMTEDNIQHLFEPFFSTKETGKGTGLGLSITHRIVEDHHGTIDPFSKGPGCGSTFSIRLPRRQPKQRAA